MKVSKGNVPKQIPELRGTMAAMQFPAFVETKYDGEFSYVHYRKDKPSYTINKYGTIRQDFIALNVLDEFIKNAHTIDNALFLAELFYDEGYASQLYKLLSHKHDNALGLKIFDIAILNDQAMNQDTLMDRKETLLNIFNHKPVKALLLVDPILVHEKTQADDCFKTIVALGYEGCVVKACNSPLVLGPCAWVKLKHKDRTDYQVMMIDKTLERIEVEVRLPTFNKNCGLKVMNKDKATIKVGDWVTVEHQGVLDTGGLRHPVYIKKA